MPASTKSYRPETRLVHAGTLRSQFGETSEALFLTQGYVYPTAEECEARFSGKIPGYVYSRYSNPTMSMFEQRMAAFEGAEAARSTATGMAAVTTALMGLVRAGDHVVAAKALFGSCRWVIEEWLPRFGVTSTLVNGTDLDAWKKAVQKNTKAFFLETPNQSDAGGHRHRRGRGHRAQCGRQACRRQCVRHTALSKPAHARCRLCRLFGDQTHRRPGPGTRWHYPGLREVDPRSLSSGSAADRAFAVAVQCLDSAQGSGDAAGACAATDRQCRRGRRMRLPATRRSRG